MKDETLPLPPNDPAHSRDAIAAEIADHLAAAEEDLTKRGTTPGEARTVARKRFGDVEKIQKTCYWIQNGETIMLRWTLIALASALCILLGLSVLGNWRTQSQLADEMGKLSAELKALATAKQAPLPAPPPPEISGVIFSGAKDKPAAEVDVAILRTDGTVVRRIRSDKLGAFRSGPLETGDYSVTAPITGAPPVNSRWVAQSEPLILHSGSGTVPLNLDTQFHAGGIKVSTKRNLPEFTKQGSYLVASRLWVFAGSSRKRNHLWTSEQRPPASWPIFCEPSLEQNGLGIGRTRSLTDENLDGLLGFTSVYLDIVDRKAIELPFNSYSPSGVARFPTGETEISLVLSLIVLPIDEKGDVILSSNRYQGRLDFRPPNREQKSFTVPWSQFKQQYWGSLPSAEAWLDKLADFPVADASIPNWPRFPRAKIEIREGMNTVLNLEIPDTIEAEIRKAVEESSAAKFWELVNDGLLKRSLKIASTTYEPIAK